MHLAIVECYSDKCLTHYVVWKKNIGDGVDINPFAYKKFKPEIYKVVERQEEKSNSLECDRIVFRCQEKRIGRGGNLFLALPVIDTRGSIIYSIQYIDLWSYSS